MAATQPTTLKQVRALQAAYEWASTNNGGKSMMQLEEITPPDPRLAGWNADDAPVALRCLACAVEPKQASSLIRELHDALPAFCGVAHVKRVKKGDDGKLRVVLAAEAVYDDVVARTPTKRYRRGGPNSHGRHWSRERAGATARHEGTF